MSTMTQSRAGQYCKTLENSIKIKIFSIHLKVNTSKAKKTQIEIFLAHLKVNISKVYIIKIFLAHLKANISKAKKTQ